MSYLPDRLLHPFGNHDYVMKTMTPEEKEQDEDRRAAILERNGLLTPHIDPRRNRPNFRALSAPLPSGSSQNRITLQEAMRLTVPQDYHKLCWELNDPNGDIILENLQLADRFPIVTLSPSSLSEEVMDKTCIVSIKGEYVPRFCSRKKKSNPYSDKSEKDRVQKAAAILNWLKRLPKYNPRIQDYMRSMNALRETEDAIFDTLRLMQQYQIVPENLVEKVPKRANEWDIAHYVIKKMKDGSYQSHCVYEREKENPDNVMDHFFEFGLATHAAEALNFMRKLIKPRRQEANV